MLAGDILDVVSVHAELIPIALALINVLAKVNVKLWPVLLANPFVT